MGLNQLNAHLQMITFYLTEVNTDCIRVTSMRTPVTDAMFLRSTGLSTIYT